MIPYTPPKPGDLRPSEHLQIGPITQYVTSLERANGDGEIPAPHHGVAHTTG